MREPDFSLDDYAEFGKVRVYSRKVMSFPVTLGLLGLSIDEAKQAVADLAAAIEWYERRQPAADRRERRGEMRILQLAVDCWNRREAARIASLKLLQELNRAVATRKVRQRTIAKQTGVSDAFVSDVLKGKRNFSDALLGRILKADFATAEPPTAEPGGEG